MTYPSAQEIDKMVNDRQQVSDDLGRLTQDMRSTARELATTQPAASGKLRSALEGLDENELDTRLQRSSDRLRRGEFSDQEESALTGDLQKLGQQVGDAARALGSAQATSRDAEINRAMDELSRVRDQLAGLGGQPNPQAGQGQPGRGGQPGQFQAGQLMPNGQQPGQGGQQGQQQGQNGQGKQGGQGKGGQGKGGQAGQGQGQGQGGQPGDRIADTQPGGGGRGGPAFGNIDTGNNGIPGQSAVPRPQGPTPADTQAQIDQGLSLLNQVRPVVQDSPEAKQQLQSLIDQMRNLDPSRFPGNQGLMEQIHQQLVSEVDALELQLRRQLDQGKGGTIRNADPSKVPPGYQDSVAEYYRKLSGGGH